MKQRAHFLLSLVPWALQVVSSPALGDTRRALLLDGFDTSDAACDLKYYDKAIDALQAQAAFLHAPPSHICPGERLADSSLPHPPPPLPPPPPPLPRSVVDRILSRLVAVAGEERLSLVTLPAAFPLFGIAIVGRRPFLRHRRAKDHLTTFAHNQSFRHDNGVLGPQADCQGCEEPIGEEQVQSSASQLQSHWQSPEMVVCAEGAPGSDTTGTLFFFSNEGAADARAAAVIDDSRATTVTEGSDMGELGPFYGAVVLVRLVFTGNDYTGSQLRLR